MLNKSFLLLVLITVTITVTACSKTVITPKKALASVAFPQHPGTIKIITMLDKSVRNAPASEFSEVNQFVYYNNKNHKVDRKNAVKSIPITEVRMYSMGEGNKLVAKKKASYLFLEMYSADGKLLDAHTMWRGGVRGGKRKVE